MTFKTVMLGAFTGATLIGFGAGAVAQTTSSVSDICGKGNTEAKLTCVMQLLDSFRLQNVDLGTCAVGDDSAAAGPKRWALALDTCAATHQVWKVIPTK